MGLLKRASLNRWFRSGSPWVWLNAGAVSVSLVLVIGLLMLIAVRGLGHFWPKSVLVAQYQEPGQLEHQIVAGEQIASETVSAQRIQATGLDITESEAEVTRQLLKTGNRDLTGNDFVWLIDQWLNQQEYPATIMTVERREWGNFYGYLKSINESGKVLAVGEEAWPLLLERLTRVQAIHETIVDIEKHQIGRINNRLERLRLSKRKRELDNTLTPLAQADIEAERSALDQEYQALEKELMMLYQSLNRDSIIAETVAGETLEIPLGKIVRAYRPNAMTLPEKLTFYGEKLFEFVSEEPREANTEGGVFPAIFGSIQKVNSTDYIFKNKIHRTQNRAIHMRFCGQMNYSIKFMCFK